MKKPLIALFLVQFSAVPIHTRLRRISIEFFGTDEFTLLFHGSYAADLYLIRHCWG
jgi:hypothetical protein